MTKVKIEPGICNLPTTVEAHSEDQLTVHISAKTACPRLRELFDELGDTLNVFDVLLKKPGEGLVYDRIRASNSFPTDIACPAIIGLLKCIEAECALALPQDCSIRFISSDTSEPYAFSTRVL